MRVVVLFLLCLFSETAIAQTSECQSIPKAIARLACYDKISPPIAAGKIRDVQNAADVGAGAIR